MAIYSSNPVYNIEQGKYERTFKIDSASDVANLPTNTEKKSGYDVVAIGSKAIEMNGDFAVHFLTTTGWN